jgi:hypothetical protein
MTSSVRIMIDSAPNLTAFGWHATHSLSSCGHERLSFVPYALMGMPSRGASRKTEPRSPQRPRRLPSLSSNSPKARARLRPSSMNPTRSSSAAEELSSERPRHSEVEQLTVELTSLKHQHELLIEQHQAAGSLFASLQAQNEELSAAQEQLAAEYQKQIENEKLARAQLATELFHLRAESDEMARLAEQWISAAMPVPTVPFASGEELEPGQIPIEALGRGIAESGYLERLLAETLEKSGGRTHRSRDGQGSTQPAALGQT